MSCLRILKHSIEPSRTESKIYKLSLLYEASSAAGGICGRYASGFNTSKNLGRKIAQAMGLAGFNTKKNQRTPKARRRMMPKGGLGRVNTAPVPNKPRHRKYFGLLNPHDPY